MLLFPKESPGCVVVALPAALVFCFYPTAAWDRGRRIWGRVSDSGLRNSSG